MKQNLENNIKESLRDFEVPYDPAAWSAMSQKLEQVMPSSPKSNWKWYLGGAATVAAIAVAVTFWSNDTATDVEDTHTAINDQNVASQKGNTNTTTEKAQISEDKVNEEVPTIDSPSASDVTASNKLEKSTNNASSNSNHPTSEKPINNATQYNDPFANIPNIGNGSGNGTGKETTSKEILIPAIYDFCLGETISIENKNNVNLIIKDSKGISTSIRANKSIDFNAPSDGEYSIGYNENGNFVAKESFMVLSEPKADFSIDDQNKYENGIPSIDMKATTPGASYSWKFENQSGNITGKDVSVHYFSKGNYDITLTVTGSNGCKGSETKSIQIDDDYNLLAVTAFDPMSNDIRKNTFVPFALTQRSVDFNMIVIDPTDGGVVFETNDATKPWTGLDRRNGQMVAPNKTYIWKVVLNNPVKGEPSEYKGMIIRL